jgi:hypothetical protein
MPRHDSISCNPNNSGRPPTATHHSPAPVSQQTCAPGPAAQGQGRQQLPLLPGAVAPASPQAPWQTGGRAPARRCRCKEPLTATRCRTNTLTSTAQDGAAPAYMCSAPVRSQPCPPTPVTHLGLHPLPQPLHQAAAPAGALVAGGQGPQLLGQGLSVTAGLRGL